MKQIPASLLTLVAGVVITIVSWWAAHHHGMLPEQASVQAPLIDGLFNTMFGMGTALFIIVEGAIVLSVILFRKRKGDETDGDPTEGNVPLEILWTFIPAVIVIGLGVYSVDVYKDIGGFGAMDHHGGALASADSGPKARLVMDGEMEMERTGPDLNATGIGVPRKGGNSRPADMEVNVSGMQYAWLFEYPGTDIVAGELHVPIDTDVQLNLSAVDVIHSFWVPQFRLKQDAIPGQNTKLRFIATKVGEYPVVCAELCGAYHGGMRASVVVHEPEDYQSWLAENIADYADNPNSTIAQLPEQGSFVHSHLENMGIAHLNHQQIMMP